MNARRPPTFAVIPAKAGIQGLNGLFGRHPSEGWDPAFVLPGFVPSLRRGLVDVLINNAVPAPQAGYFLLLRQKKVTKEKATPGYATPLVVPPHLGPTQRRRGILPRVAATGIPAGRPFGALTQSRWDDERSTRGPNVNGKKPFGRAASGGSL